ncbi:MAG TPA: glutathione S-transferase, partial [Pseudomonadales bacterium]|nr:glutathione S-transferase [Pseudomonadales bacterium]
MIIVHHLNNSRSQRILWLLEELGVDYEIKKYQRDTTTNLAPPELTAVHPLGKSPVITDDDVRIHESAAIVDYLINQYGNGALQPAHDTRDYVRYVEWMHYAEGSAMLPLLLNLYTSRLGDAAAPLAPRIQSEIENHFSFMEAELEGRQYFVGDNLTGADIMLSFPLEAAKATGQLVDSKNIAAFVDRVQA